MGSRWNPKFEFSCFLVLILSLHIRPSRSSNSEGLILLEFRVGLSSDPHGALVNWNPSDTDHCSWLGVHCVEGKVQKLDLSGLSLEGNLAPVLGQLIHLKSLVLPKNQFSGAIPKEFGRLTKLEVLDLRDNNLSGKIPTEIGKLSSLKRLLLYGNKFEGIIPQELGRLKVLSELEFDEGLTSAMASGTSRVNRKFGNCMWQDSLKELDKEKSFVVPIKGVLIRYLNALPLLLFKLGKDSEYISEEDCCDNLPSSLEPHMVQNAQNIVNLSRRRLLEQQSHNLAAAPASGGPISEPLVPLATTRSSGTFPAIPNENKRLPVVPASAADLPPTAIENPRSFRAPPNGQAEDNSNSRNVWNYLYIIPSAAMVFIVVAAIFVVFRKRAMKTIGPWKTGLSGQLQKAFVTGVPKLNRSELETACEDFSNIIETFDGCTIYKGTLSSGVEIAVASTVVKSLKEWSKTSDMAYRKKIDMLSRINHKNFVNLIGYCEENEPFNRMMVFEYAPNGSLCEHLHVEGMEHLDWNARMRIIMGIAYCLQYLHHDLNPPIAHSNLTSTAILLTDDYAPKIAEICFGVQSVPKSMKLGEDEAEHSELPPVSDPETNVYSFGILLLEIISGKLPYSEEQGHLVKWAAEYLNDKKSISYMIDPALKSFKDNELDVVCEVIQACIQPDPRHRPTMKEVTPKLREVINISPDQATPRLSPLWWAELEILSAEAT